MANALAEIYSNSALIPIDRVIALLEVETSPKKLADFAKQVEAVKRIHADNEQRKTYWESLALWSKKRLGEVTLAGKKNKEIALQGRPRRKGERLPLFTLADLGLDKKQVQAAENLAAVPEDQLRAYIEKQKESGDAITAAGAIRAAKPSANGKPKRNGAAPAKDREPGDDEPDPKHIPQVDSLKRELPESLREAFASVKQFQATMRAISDCKTEVDKLCESPGGGHIDRQECERLLKQARDLLRFAMPYTECPKCRRKLEKKCAACFGQGWIHERMYDTASSDEDKLWLTKN